MQTENDVVVHVITTLEDLAIPYLVGGSWALSTWATPRLTHDVDIVVDLPLPRIPEFCARFPLEEFYIDPVFMAQQFRQPTSPSGGMYSFIHRPTGLKIDLFPLKSHDQVEVAAFARRVSAPLLENKAAMVSTPQDLLIQKLRWWQLGGRQSERQFRDCVNLLLADLSRSSQQIDWAEVDRLAEQLGPDVFAAWQLIWDAVDQAQREEPNRTN